MARIKKNETLHYTCWSTQLFQYKRKPFIRLRIQKREEKLMEITEEKV